MGEGGFGIVEEHHAVAGDDQIERARGGPPDRRVAPFESDAGTAPRPVARGGDQGVGQIEAGNRRIRQRLGQSEAGGAGAAADVEDVPRLEGDGAREQRLVDRRERAIGPPPLLRPGVADLSPPLDRLGHAAS